jgi:hypothetical protein
MPLDSFICILCGRIILGLSLFTSGLVPATLAADQSNPILAELLEKGLDTGKGLMVKLPKPTMADGLDAAKQMDAIKTIANPNRPLQRIMQNMVEAPFDVRVTPAPNSPTAFHVDLSYIAYGSLETVAKEKFLKGLADEDQKNPNANPPKAKHPDDKHKLPNKSVDIGAAELGSRSIQLPPKEMRDERYAYSLFELMDKVYLSITTRTIQTRTGESITLAGYVDPRFMNDTQYPNQWQPITQNNLGLPVLGKPLPYSGAGGYLKVTQLKQPADALFIEAHLVYDEPKAWFGGVSLLRSKIPILARDNVKTFRQKLKAAEQEKDQGSK